LGKEEDDGDGVVNVGQVGVDVEAAAEGLPTIPVVVMCLGTFRRDSGSDRFLNKAEISPDFI
jgi:hypothetical protein